MKVFTHSNKGVRGYASVLLAAALWASSGSFSKYLFTRGSISTFDLVQARITLAAIFLFLVLFFTERSRLKVSIRSAGYFFQLGFAGMATVQFTYLFAISRINVASAILIQYLAPAFMAVYFLLTGRDRITLSTIFALIMSITGCFFVAAGKKMGLGDMDTAGVLSALCSAMAFAFYSVKGEEGMKQYRPSTVLLYALLYAAVAWNIFRAPFSWIKAVPDPACLAAVMYIAVFGTVVPFLLYFRGMEMIRPTRACITATIEPVIAGMISWVLVGEKMDAVQIGGGIIVIFSVIVLQLKSGSVPEQA